MRTTRSVATAIALTMTLTVVVPLALALTMTLTVTRAVSGTVADGLAVAIPAEIARTARRVRPAVAVALDGCVRGFLRALVMALSTLVADHSRTVSIGVSLCSCRAGRGTGPHGIAVPEMRRQRMHGDGDGHKRVRRRMGVVTDRHLRRRVLSGCRRRVHERDEPRRVARSG